MLYYGNHTGLWHYSNAHNFHKNEHIVKTFFFIETLDIKEYNGKWQIYFY